MSLFSVSLKCVPVGEEEQKKCGQLGENWQGRWLVDSSLVTLCHPHEEKTCNHQTDEHDFALQLFVGKK